jgi:hypothetical protein
MFLIGCVRSFSNRLYRVLAGLHVAQDRQMLLSLLQPLLCRRRCSAASPLPLLPLLPLLPPPPSPPLLRVRPSFGGGARTRTRGARPGVYPRGTDRMQRHCCRCCRCCRRCRCRRRSGASPVRRSCRCRCCVSVRPSSGEGGGPRTRTRGARPGVYPGGTDPAKDGAPGRACLLFLIQSSSLRYLSAQDDPHGPRLGPWLWTGLEGHGLIGYEYLCYLGFCNRSVLRATVHASPLPRAWDAVGGLGLDLRTWQRVESNETILFLRVYY